MTEPNKPHTVSGDVEPQLEIDAIHRSEFDRDLQKCVEVIKAAGGKPVRIDRLREATGKNLATQPAIRILANVKGITHKVHKMKHYFVWKEEA